MKRILITGRTSYIGNSFREFVAKYYDEEFQVESVSVRDTKWRELNLSVYDVVLNVAGIAHADVGNVSVENQKKYFEVNRDLAFEIASKYKLSRQGKVSQYIYLSSLIVYGSKVKFIDKNTKERPDNFYGESKLQAEQKLYRLIGDNFTVNCIRPPMIYGRNSKGNFRLLIKLAKYAFVFPKYSNERSVLFIDNLCEFISLVILRKEDNFILFPQNIEKMQTSSVISDIRRARNSNTFLISGFSRLIDLIILRKIKIGILANKAFGTLVYDEKLSSTAKINIEDYQKTTFSESIRRTVN